MLNIMALVFGRMPEQAPFFIKPLLRAVSNKAEQGTPHLTLPLSGAQITDPSVLWPSIEDEFGVY